MLVLHTEKSSYKLIHIIPILKLMEITDQGSKAETTHNV